MSSGRRPLGRTVRLVGRAVRLVHRADPRLLRYAAAAQLVAGLGAGAQLLAARHVLDGLLDAPGGGWWRHVLPAIATFAVVALVVAVAAQAQTALSRLLTEHAIRHVSEDILRTAAGVDLLVFEEPSFYDRLRRAQEQGVVAPLRVVGGLTSLVAAVVGALGLFAAVTAIQPLLAPFVVLAYLPLWIVSARNSRAIYAFTFGNTPGDRARFALEEVLTGRDTAKEVRAFALYPFLLGRWQRLYDVRLGGARAVVRAQLRRSVLAAGLAALLTAGTFAVLAALVAAGRLDVAGAIAAAVGVQQLGARLDAVGTGVNLLYESALFLDDLATFVDGAPAPAGTDRAAAPPAFGTLRTEAVTFVYPGAARPALDGVDVEIRAGEVVALVGVNGSGKTTLAKVLCGLYPPAAGRVTWDGTDVATWSPASVRDRVAVIFQDFARYHLSAADNIGAGRPERAGELPGIAAAARAAGAHGFLAALPAGYDTPLSREFEGGTDLSGGQWQRVALARAFFRDAPFVVLDEPTAALDPRAEQDLFAGMRDLCAGRAVLLISHRFSTVRSADRIYVLDAGRVVESGSHAELMARGGRYAELYTLQSSLYADELS